MGLDRRIGPGALRPGPGFGGSCLPKDTAALLSIAKGLGYDFKIMEAVVEVNKRQRLFMMEKIRKALGGLDGKVIGVLGLTYKPDTDDVRESPAIDIIKGLIGEGGSIRACDPAGVKNARVELGDAVTYCADAYETAEGADCLVVVTEWNQFRKLDIGRIKGLLKRPVLVDLRNVYEPKRMAEAGLDYISVGREAAFKPQALL
jgi:UDPglucose 6-dehydrogenase